MKLISFSNISVFPKIGVPQIVNFYRGFHYKPSILGCPYFWKHPYRFLFVSKGSVEPLDRWGIFHFRKRRLAIPTLVDETSVSWWRLKAGEKVEGQEI